MRGTGTLTRLFIGALFVAVTLTGCSQGVQESEQAQEALPQGSTESPSVDRLIEEGLANAKSDFQREVLTKVRDSGSLSEADWKEANTQRAQCLQDKGFAVEIIYDGADVLLQADVPAEDVGPSGAEDSGLSSADQECYEKTSAFINEIYSSLNGGAQSVDSDGVQRAVLQCLIDRELVPADTSYEEFVTDLEQNEGKQFSPQGTGDNDPIAACWTENS